jgi:hypothetical protein
LAHKTSSCQSQNRESSGHGWPEAPAPLLLYQISLLGARGDKQPVHVSAAGPGHKSARFTLALTGAKNEIIEGRDNGGDLCRAAVKTVVSRRLGALESWDPRQLLWEVNNFEESLPGRWNVCCYA